MACVSRLASVLLSAAAFVPSVALAQVAAPGEQPRQDAPVPGGVSQPAGEAVANDSSAATNPDDVIVTARRRDERLVDAPVAITAVSGTTLSQYQVTRVSDLATLVPSLVAGRAASGSSASIFLRGVGSTALSAGFDQSVSFVIDGIAMSRGREISLPQFDIQSVEVLKGPQALFFGKNTTGGLISVTSNSPTNSFDAGIKAGYGFEARDRYVEGYISGPVSDSVRLRLAGRYGKSDGAFINTAAPTYTNYIGTQVRTSTGPRRGGGETFGARATADWDVSPNFSLQLKGGVSSVNDGGATDLVERICGSGRTTPLAANGRPPSPNADCVVNGRSDQSAIPLEVAQANYRYARDGFEYADFDSQYAVLTGKITSDPFDVTSITGFTHFRQVDLNNVSGEAYPATFTQFVDFKQFSQEIRFQTKFGGPFQMQFGGYYANGKFVLNSDAYILPVPIDPVLNTYRSFQRNNGFSNDAMSVFAEGTLNITPQFELSGGARYSLESRDSYQFSFASHPALAAAFPGGLSLTDRYRDTNLSPQITLRYKPGVDTTIYASYKQGFKAGGFNISAGLTAASTRAGSEYRPETAEGAEIGLRTLLVNRRLSLNVTAYRYDYSDLQVQFFDPVTISQVSGNAGRLRTQGVEADFNFRVPSLTGLSLRGAAAYNDAKFHDYIGACYAGQTVALGCNLVPANGRFNAQNYEGRTPPKAPRFAGRLGATFETPITDSGIGVRLTGDAGYTSRYNFSDALRPDAVQRGYTKIDASLAVTGPDGRWSLSLIGRNLTNKLVVTAANDIPFAGGTGAGTTTGVTADMSAFVDNPREVFVELSVKF
ncbi:TonB-dependent receptor [Sphingomonas sp.]|uniref:TonB-dependent receptor n=1 Tax=Sphingomonas sp. TaxID=28214 RepID=UPI003CC52019